MTPTTPSPATKARADLAAGNRVEALRIVAAAMATDLEPAVVDEVVTLLDAIRRTK